jgi:hypothetical protein
LEKTRGQFELQFWCEDCPYGDRPVTINTAAVSFGKTQIEQGQLAVQIDDRHSTPTVDDVKYG